MFEPVVLMVGCWPSAVRAPVRGQLRPGLPCHQLSHAHSRSHDPHVHWRGAPFVFGLRDSCRFIVLTSVRLGMPAVGKTE